MSASQFTIILCCYNHEAFVDQTIDSILAQTVRPDEIVFFDDGSTDRSREIVQRRLGKFPGFRQLDRCEVNLGLITRLVQANELVRDGFVIPLSCDDVMTPNAVEIHRDVLARSGAEWSIAATQVTDMALAPGAVIRPVQDLRRGRGRLFETLLAMDPWLPMTGWAYSIQLFRRVGGYDTRFLVDDYSLGLRFAREATPALTDEIVKYWRRYDGSFTMVFGPEMWRDHAAVALEEGWDHPVLARKVAAQCYASAARALVKAGRVREALFDEARSAALWPQPLRVAREMASIVKSAWR